MQNYQHLLYSVDNLVATITINRPEVLNAWTQLTLHEIEDALKTAGSDSKVGVVVLTGTGDKAFCVGGDVNWEREGGLADKEYTYNLAHAISECPKPVIARVNGWCIGGGHHLAYFCDVTIASDNSRFGQAGPRVGSPAAGYMVSHSANILGHKRAMELWLMCRQYTAHQMLDWGLVNTVVPKQYLDAEVRRWADEMLSLSPTCLKIIKASFRHKIDNIMDQDMATVVNRVAPGYFETGEQHEGASAFLEKRKPNFDPWR
ncbi:1,4-dihydroxy-6-naphthoate synthase [Pseudomaricurvus alkylphenolicus]|uniref:enoyl-CoA hydratase-related protein n=1 Tax=Pseudomaricurvus alkylphenolicus TaxID=1306991 RepID=UPI001424649A|nr:enoyl-CoA hydratase-related protein [Pseudomaricurvus alkylphenolicus]NIB40842.1 1,4-dihydroxy-6-naphthoate synthase [Pseudomaricurvus alkylphenolicus]